VLEISEQLLELGMLGVLVWLVLPTGKRSQNRTRKAIQK
jgi:hypothetical protein